MLIVHSNNTCACVDSIFSLVVNKSGHSDPRKLKETAEDVQRLSPDELKKRQMEIKVKIICYSWLRYWNK